MRDEKQQDTVSKVQEIIAMVVAIWITCLMLLIPTVYLLRWVF